MPRQSTYFEQVPVAKVKKLAADFQFPDNSASCAICQRPVRIEDCNTDENGRAVHGLCYGSRLQRVRTSRARHTDQTVHRFDNEL